MNDDEFINYIESIGFKNKVGYYGYNGYCIISGVTHYDFYNGSIWLEYDYNILKPIKIHFNKELRSIKLKKLLN